MADLVAFSAVAAAWVLLAGAAGLLARRRGRSGLAWTLAALVISAPVAVALLLLLRRRTAEPLVSGTAEPDAWDDRVEPIVEVPGAFEDERPPPVLEPQDWAAPISTDLDGPAVFEAEQAEPLAPEPPPAVPAYEHRLPRYVAFVDVETTGLGAADRIVSFACIFLATEGLAFGRFDTRVVYCLFNPGRPSTPEARAVHGYTDDFLALQERFAERVDAYDLLLSNAELVVGHNVRFDLGMIDRELALLGRAQVAARRYCTMREFQARGGFGSARLDAVAASIGLSRGGATHGALEDAWLAMMIYLHQQGCPHRLALSDLASR